MSQYEKPAHAAALKYSPDSPRNAPVVVAAGLGYVAQKIIDVAQENSVPVFQDDALASLLSQLSAGSEIPPELYQAIVDIYVYFLNYSADGIANNP
jgi:flagellar biosynthesis protein